MELKKGQNMIEHEEEIYSRPARTWFQSGQEKLKAEGSSNVVCYFLFNPFFTNACAAVSKKSYEAGFEPTTGSAKDKKAVDETKVSPCSSQC